ncbi:acyl-CoA thioesterase-1 [Sphingomonas jejuensis]|uniref:Acyl-CoA thioesterase-1 n=1 Tax=Sphingomonas jejuensis TaxID=904715 RepID=A0ABX0XN41_9SPHN|nr:arylesterase [Sphingomonas jejuensis]NJC34690.1 acyl-CoA thioesterase-1 [Sphingomonas jejuensis]
MAVLLQALALAGCGQATAPEANVAAPAPARPAAAAADRPVAGPERLVLAFGDSLYAGYGLEDGQSLPDALQRRLRAAGINARVVNAGVSGDTSAAGRQRLQFTLDNLPRTPDLVVLGLGGNDMLRRIPAAETRANLAAMLDVLDGRDIPVVLTGMLAAPNLGPDYACEFNGIYPDLAREHDATLDPFILDGALGRPSMMLPDGIHPSAAGVEVIADRLAPLLERRLGQPAAASTSG